MITLEQIMLLESKVQKAVEKISQLHQENITLRKQLGQYEDRVGELEMLLSRFKDDQNRIEQGIINALNQLDIIEDSADEIRTSGPAGRDAVPREVIDESESSSVSDTMPSGETLFTQEDIEQDDILDEDEGAFVLHEDSPSSPRLTSESFEPLEEEQSKEAELDIF